MFELCLCYLLPAYSSEQLNILKREEENTEAENISLPKHKSSPPKGWGWMQSVVENHLVWFQ